MAATNDLTVAICQMTSTDDVDANLMQIESLIEQIDPAQGVRIAFFPENALYLRLKEGESIRGVLLEDDVVAKLQEHARSRRMHLHLVSPFRLDGHLYNSSLWITDFGELRPSYQKMHLFDIALINGPTVRESDVFRHGSAPSIIEVDGWRFGESICYDLRFSELYSLYARNGVDGILVPAAFLSKTGEAHWDILLRARAIESQCYVLAAAQAGVHRGTDGGVRETYGHSLVVAPWGSVSQQLKEKGPGVLIQTLQRAELERVRSQIPMSDHRRLPLGMTLPR